MGRMRSMLTDKAYANKGTLIPFLLILLFPFIALFFPLAALAITLAYLTTIVLTGIQGSYRTHSKTFLVLVPALFIIEHFSYFFGIFYGILFGKWKKPTIKSAVFYQEIICFKDNSEAGTTFSNIKPVST